MKYRMICLLLFILLPLSFISAETFTAIGMQFEISSENYTSEDMFFEAVDSAIAAELSAEHPPDIIVFPEYIGVFYQLIPFNDVIKHHSSFQSALLEVLDENPQFTNMADVFIGLRGWETYLEGWSILASKYGVTILAGSCFISDDGDNLRNRAFVFNPEGELQYSQDKVFLTEFETGIIGLSPGRLEDAGFFKVKERDIAMTICRDAYSAEWERKNSGAFLWVDIKANGEYYDSVQQRSFMRALPSRLMNSDVPFGMTVCAVGHYLDLFWEGESSAIYRTADGLALADISDSYDAGDRISISIATGQ